MTTLTMLGSSLLLALAATTGDSCRLCEKTGVVPCPEHDEELHAYEAGVLFCSIAAECEQCRGALLVVCKRCKTGPDEHLIAERQKAVEVWLAKQQMASFLERPIPTAETEHFQLVVNTGTLKQGKKKIDEHVILHQVAQDVEEVARLIGEHYKLDGEKSRLNSDTPYASKMRMWIWKDPTDHQRVMRKFLNSAATGDYKLLGRDPVFSVWTEGPFSTVPAVRRVFTHNSAHMLLSNLYKELWTGDIGGGWFDAGSAHWYEYEIHKLSVNYCIEEATANLDFHGGVWRAPIRKWLQREEARLLPALMDKHTGAMTLPEQALCWSVYDWIVAEHVEALPLLQQGLKRREPSRDLLRDALGGSLLELEDAWRAWVAVTYPTKGDVPLEPKRKR